MKTLLANHINTLGTPMKNNFEVYIPGYDITLAVKNSPIPKMATEQVEHNYGNGKVYTAGKTAPDGTWDITARQFLEADVVKTLLAWRKKVYDEKTGATGRPSDYKVKEAFIYQYDPAGNLLHTWVVEGVWPTVVDVGEGDYDSGDPCEVMVSLSYDLVYRSDRDSFEPVEIKA